MRDPRNEGGGYPLDLVQNFLADETRAAAYERLIEQVFGSAPTRSRAPDPDWEVLAYFDEAGSCVAGLEIGKLALVLDGIDGVAMAIRLVGVAPAHRGRGLFRQLMEGAFRIGDRHGHAVPTLLYAETADLYSRFGFVPLAQHAFVGAPLPGAPLRPARLLDPAEAETSIRRLAPARAPISRHCAIRGAVDLLQSNLDDPDLRFALLEAEDALVVYELDDDALTIVDIVAAEIPTMAEIVGALGSDARCVRTLFAPDRLGWEGMPTRDETGLMIRGRVPPAMQRPFMLPPTTSF